ncbi:MAG TPA: DUF2007 domain-containing protein [Anaerolineaceae bacterium]|jgi:hypothetical protein|nr:DUF2007 domain-containing protein [Anaerolineaceae bacterium]
MSKIDDFESVYSASGRLDGEMMKNLLESFEIQCVLLGESVGSTYGLTVTPVGKVEVMVHSADVERAEQIIQEYQNGLLEEKES